MKILMVNYEWPLLGGGGEVAMRDVATELSKRHGVHVLTFGATGLPPEEERLRQLLEAEGVRLGRIYVYPHAPEHRQDGGHPPMSSSDNGLVPPRSWPPTTSWTTWGQRRRGDRGLLVKRRKTGAS